MSWLFSQALVAEYSAGSCSVGEPSAQLNVMPTARPFWRNDKTMDCSRPSLFGLTSRLLTADHGEAVLMSFLAAFPVRTSPSPDLAMGLTGLARDSGASLRGWFAKWSREKSSWRTAQCSLVEDLELYSETWPRWGSMRDGACYPLPISAHGICESASGFALPTPVAADTGQLFNRSASEGAATRPTLGAMARFNLWPTPTICGNYNRKGASATSGDGLATFVMKLLPTPTCGGGGQTLPEGSTITGMTPDGKKRTVSLEQAVFHLQRKMLPTPTVAMVKGSSGGALTRKNGRGRDNDRLDYAIERDGTHGRLNPTWVEWFMGWPTEWTALKPLETAKFREWQQQHGECLAEKSE